jgi:hypothetical protein
MKLESGKVELGFVDSYKFNIAAYRLAELVASTICCRSMSNANGKAKPAR